MCLGVSDGIQSNIASSLEVGGGQRLVPASEDSLLLRRALVMLEGTMGLQKGFSRAGASSVCLVGAKLPKI